ncbi:hypothetical protein Pka01_46940 [Planotetraspora kaengkrachanensis]|uniref:Uncharacterized protein n=2 Tax=Planotetraspora kaengkrachanensis TaxID=575193 RepID=A0A8J3V790_9ACTN|nr:hypothetical protein Pka01_46940 [Planotetraspora kaengkrachanensis]
MWTQLAISLLGLWGLVNTASLRFSVATLIAIVSTAVVGVLAAGYHSRKKWVRVAALVIEGLVILDHGYGLMFDFNLISLLYLILAVIVVVRLSRSAAAAWFNR